MKNKLTKVGLSALCGSLACVSAATAGTLNVSGSAGVTYSTGTKTTVGNPIGMNSGITFTGTGELDNGTSFKYTITNADQAAFSAASIVLDMPVLGQIRFGAADGGSGIDAYDDAIPTAWEETWGTSVGTGVHLINGVGSSMNVQYKTPVILGPLGATLAIAYAPRVNGTSTNDKAQGGTSGGADSGQGLDVTLNLNPNWGDWNSGLNIFAGAHRNDKTEPNRAVAAKSHNREHGEGVLGAKLAIGPVTVGGQKTAEFVAGPKRTGTDTDYYTGAHVGVAINVNDNLALSWGNMRSKRYFVDPSANEAVELEAESIQVSYTMGGMGIILADTDVTNAAYGTGTSADLEGTTVKLSFAF